MKQPHTPFSTRLSGNAKETELRLRSIFQWQKKRPPFLLFGMLLVICIGCGSLIACKVQELPTAADSKTTQNLDTVQADAQNAGTARYEDGWLSFTYPSEW